MNDNISFMQMGVVRTWEKLEKCSICTGTGWSVGTCVFLIQLTLQSLGPYN